MIKKEKTNKSKLYEFDHKDLDEMNWGQLATVKETCEMVIPTIDSAINPGLCIYWSGKLKKAKELMKNK